MVGFGGGVLFRTMGRLLHPFVVAIKDQPPVDHIGLGDVLLIELEHPVRGSIPDHALNGIRIRKEIHNGHKDARGIPGKDMLAKVRRFQD